MSEHDMLPSEPVTIVLSQMGWCAAPKDTTLTPVA